MSIQYQIESPFYYCLGQIFIMADHPEAAATMQKCPDVPVVNQKTLDLIVELTSSKATAEGKLRLLGDAIRLMQSDETLVHALRSDTARKESISEGTL